MSYCITSTTLLLIFRREFISDCYLGRHDLERRALPEGCPLKAGIVGFGEASGRLVRRWTSRGVIRQIRSGVSL
jgi:hypothetical protein